MLCDYDETMSCRLCGHVAKRLPTYRECTATVVRLPRVAVGTLLQTMLRALGVTEDRVKEWLRVKDCGCSGRKALLDRWGYKQQDRVERMLNRAAKFYFELPEPRKDATDQEPSALSDK